MYTPAPVSLADSSAVHIRVQLSPSRRLQWHVHFTVLEKKCI